MEWVVLDWFPDPGPFRGQDGIRRLWDMWKDTFDDFHAELEEYAESSDALVLIVRMAGRGKDSGVAVDTPSFPMVWTARAGTFVRAEMFDSRENALKAAGLPPDTQFERF
jgi:SnoaL-like domain